MRKRFFIGLLVAIASAMPLTAQAVNIQSFTFGEHQLNATWKGFGPVQIGRTRSEIVVSMQGTGAIMTNSPLVHHPAAGILTTSSDRNIDGYFVWSFDADPSKSSYSIPISIPAGTNVRTAFSIEHPFWKEGPKNYGFALPPGATVAINRFDLLSWSAWEMLVERLQSFWTFDEYRAYGINFVWGPQIATNTVQRTQMFAHQPPQTASGTQAVYVVLIVVLLLIVAWQCWKHRERSARLRGIARCTLIAFLCAWLLMDMRMGSEFLSWVWHDASTYIFQSANTRTLRERERFYDFAEFAAPLVSDRKTYVFLAETIWPYLGNIRYVTYPSIPGNAFDSDDTWVMYNRPDVTVNTAGQLNVDGLAFSQPGEVIGRFDKSSFVFRTLTSPSRKNILRPKAATPSS